MTASQSNRANESKKWMKVKVVKWFWKKSNGPMLMHIYDKQCENQWKGPNFQVQCFYNGTTILKPAAFPMHCNGPFEA